jgi:hypothetical protein
MNVPYVIVWDLDGTIGDFQALEKNRNGATAVTLKTRPGLPEALRALREAGFRHSLLTMATPAYAEIVLRATNLQDYFDRVECPDQRRKGDTAGIAALFGIAAREKKHKMIFVGDRMVFDEPDDPTVVFHLEPFALARPAVQLKKLIRHLREAGNGSLREGFLAIGRGPRRWYRLFRPSSLPLGKPMRRHIPELGALLLLERKDECPVIAYEKAPDPPVDSEEHRLVPGAVMKAKSV